MSAQMKTAASAEAIPKRKLFIMGGGKPVPPDASRDFCNSLVDGCLDGRIAGHYEIVIGFAACFDAIARGTVDLDSDPVETILQVIADINNIMITPNKITDVMRVGEGR